jgi:hypothetical protein
MIDERLAELCSKDLFKAGSRLRVDMEVGLGQRRDMRRNRDIREW